ncbi:MAG TPA: hypothetical protein VKB51_17765 [bacterium]|nr:hypothetical protein [bacterium]
MDRHQDQDVGRSVAQAIRERILTLEEELEHWRAMLEQCEQQSPATDNHHDDGRALQQALG